MEKIKARFELHITAAYRVRVDLNVWEINRIFASHDIMGTDREEEIAQQKAQYIHCLRSEKEIHLNSNYSLPSKLLPL